MSVSFQIVHHVQARGRSGRNGRCVGYQSGTTARRRGDIAGPRFLSRYHPRIAERSSLTACSCTVASRAKRQQGRDASGLSDLVLPGVSTTAQKRPLVWGAGRLAFGGVLVEDPPERLP